jgi:hypothetical protein
MAIVYRPEDLEHVRLRMAWYRVEGDVIDAYVAALRLARESPWSCEDALEVVIAHLKHGAGKTLTEWVNDCMRYGLPAMVSGAARQEMRWQDQAIAWLRERAAHDVIDREFESRGLEADGDGDGDPTIEKIIALLQADVGA